MIASWLIVASAVMGQTSQPATPPVGGGMRYSVATRTTQPAAEPQEQVTIPTTTAPGDVVPPGTTTMMQGLSGEPINIQSTATGIVITGRPEDIEFLRSIAEMMETAPETSFQVFPLQNATAQDLATNLTRLWQEAKKPPTGQLLPADRLTIIAEPRSNMLMVASSRENMGQVATLIQQLDQPSLTSGGPVQFTPIPLKNIKAAEAQKTIKEMLQTLQKQRKTDRDLFNISVDIRTNSLLVAASKADIEQIRHLVELIDVPPSLATGGIAKAAIFPLEKAVATKMAKALTEMLQANTEGGKVAEEQIRRLQIAMKSKGGDEKTLPDLDLEKPIKIQAEEGTNSIVVQSTEGNLAAIGELISTLDALPVGEEMMVKMFPLKFADADTLRQNVMDMFSQGKTLPDQPQQTGIARVPPGVAGAALVYNLAISADKRTNTLVVAGRPEQVLLVTQVITAIDVAENPNRFAPRLIKIEHADAKRLVEAAQKLADMRKEMSAKLSPTEQERERILVLNDERTNSLVVIANDENFQEIQDLVAKLDVVGDKWLGEIQIIKLQQPLAATDVADKIDSLWQRRTKQRQQAQLPEDKPQVVADTRSNALVISANKEDYEAISHLVAQLQQLPLSPMQDIREVVLKYNDATQLATTISQIFDNRLKNSTAEGAKAQPSDKVYVTSDAVTNILLVVSSKEAYDDVVKLVAQLDVPPVVEGTLRTFFIKNTDVTRAAQMLTDLFDKGIYRGSGPQKTPEGQKKVTIIPDVRSSAIIISASPENLAIVESVLKDLDRVDVPVFQADSAVVPLRNADVVQVSSILTDLMEGIRTAMGDQGKEFQLTIIPNARTNSLILSGTRLALRRAQEIIPTLDISVDRMAYETRVYRLKQASASRLEGVMTDLFEKREPSAGGKEKTPVVVIPDDSANALIVSASREVQEEITRLVEKLDQPTLMSQLMEVLPLQKAKADTIADQLQDLVKAQQGKQTGQTAFSATADERTNSLIVFASPDLMATVKDIVRRLDTAEPREVMALRVFRLQNAIAKTLSDELGEFFKAAGTGEGEKVKQMLIKFTPINPETGLPVLDPATGEKLVHTLVHQDITINPDTYTNSLMVLAPADNIEMMEMLVKMLDSIEPRTAKIQAFELRNADAEEMSKLLKDLFETSSKSSSGSEGRSLILAGGEGAAGTAGSSAGGAAGSETEVAFAVDTRTNTLIAAGTPAQLKIVESLVYRLDDQDIEERIVRVVPLQYAKSDNVASTLTSFFESESSLVEKAEEGAAAVRQLQRQVTIEATGEESNSNMLLVSYSPRLESQIVTMINELDRPPPQVMIQVLMAEVTLSNTFDMGMEFAVQDLLFSEKAYLGPNGTVQGDNFDFIGGTDLGSSGSGLAGASFTITGEDFNFLVRALQVDGRLEVLSRPALLVQDNEEATIDVGERIPVVTDINVSSTGSVTPSVTYEDVGVKLEVKPIINPDGFVNLEIKPEISALGSSSVSIASGVTLPIITQRKAETAVTVKDGETIIIGGLITSKTSESENKVPVLGDVPLVGNAFRYTKREQTKTELLMVLTPHVYRTPEDARKISTQMRDQTGLMDDLRANPLMQGLQVKPEEDQIGPDGLPPAVPTTPAPKDKDEMGPELEELGPPTTSIDFGPQRDAIVSR